MENPLGDTTYPYILLNYTYNQYHLNTFLVLVHTVQFLLLYIAAQYIYFIITLVIHFLMLIEVIYNIFIEYLIQGKPASSQ